MLCPRCGTEMRRATYGANCPTCGHDAYTAPDRDCLAYGATLPVVVGGRARHSRRAGFEAVGVAKR